MYIWLFSFTHDLVAIVWPDFQLPDLFISLAVIHGVPARRMKQIECLCETNPIDSYSSRLLFRAMPVSSLFVWSCQADVSVLCSDFHVLLSRSHDTTELGTRSKKEISRVPGAMWVESHVVSVRMWLFDPNEPNSSEL